MKISISNTSVGTQGTSTTAFEIDLPQPEDFEPDVYVEHVRHGLECMRLTGETWNDWSLEQMTPEQRAHREAEIKSMEAQREAQLKVLQAAMGVPDEPPRAA